MQRSREDAFSGLVDLFERDLREIEHRPVAAYPHSSL